MKVALLSMNLLFPTSLTSTAFNSSNGFVELEKNVITPSKFEILSNLFPF